LVQDIFSVPFQNFFELLANLAGFAFSGQNREEKLHQKIRAELREAQKIYLD